MADDLHFSSSAKRKFDDDEASPPLPPRRPTGFSSATPAVFPSPPPSYNTVPPPVDDFEIAKKLAQEIAARIFSNAEANRSENDAADDNNNHHSGFSSDYSQKPSVQSFVSHVGMTPASNAAAYGYQGSSKKIEIPNGRVGVIIGKGGETIKYLQAQSGAKMQVMREMGADPNSQTRLVELVGNPEQISRAEQLINDCLAEAEAVGSCSISARSVGNVPIGAEQFVMKVPNHKVGSIIGKGGEMIKTLQAKSGAHIQIIPLHLPPGDTSQERTVHIDGTKEQVESAKQLIIEITSSERGRNQPMSGGYSQPRAPMWGPPGGAPQMQQQQQQPSYGYMQQPAAYPSQPPQYNTVQPSYGGGYPSQYPDQSSIQQQTQQTPTATGYDYYSQQQLQPVVGSSAPSDNNSYSYGHQPPSYSSQGSYADPLYSQPTSGGPQQSYGQDSYLSSYQTQPGYAYPIQTGCGLTPPVQAPPATTHQQGCDGQQSGYGSQAQPVSGYIQSASQTMQPPSYGQPAMGYGQLPRGYSQQQYYASGPTPSQLVAAADSQQPSVYSNGGSGGAYDAAAAASPAVPTGASKATPKNLL